MRRGQVTAWSLVASLLLLSWGGMWTFAEWRYQRGLTWARATITARRFEAAREWLTVQMAARPDEGEAAFLLGVCEQGLRRPGAAAAAFARVPPKSPRGEVAAMARARVLIDELGRFAEAEEVLVAALSEFGSNAKQLRYTWTQLLYWEGRLDEMRRFLREGWADSPLPADDLHDLWRIDHAALMHQSVRNAVEKAARAAPDDDRVWLARANLARQAGRFAEAGRWLDACLERRTDDPSVWEARLRWARDADRVDEARRALPHLRADRFSRPEIVSLRAWFAARAGQEDVERAALEELVALVPGDTRALERLTILAARSGQGQRAAEWRRRKADAAERSARYFYLVDTCKPIARFSELGDLAEELGRRFDSRCWRVLARRQLPSDPTARTAGVRPGPTEPEHHSVEGQTLADLLGGGPSCRDGSVRPPVLGEAPPQPSRPDRIPHFRDDAEASGLRFVFQNGESPLRQIPETTAGGVGILDYDADGWFDVYVVQGGRFPPDPAQPSTGDRLFRNRGDGTFEDVSVRSGIARLTHGYGHGVAVGDFDNDGDPDLFLTRWRSYALHRNRGDGTFEDATEQAGLAGDRDWPTSAAFADLDHDGDLDLYVCHYLVWDAQHPALCEHPGKPGRAGAPGHRYDYCVPDRFPARPDRLFRNDGGHFIDVTQAAGIDDLGGRGLGVVAADLDADGREDLFVANDTSANYLWHNLGGMRFEEIATSAGVACNAAGAYQAGMGTAVGDLDGDGAPDLSVTNFYGESTSFFKNLGGGVFADQTAAIGLAGPSRYLLGFGIVYADVNNDGWMDLATTNGHVIDDRPDLPLEMPGLLLIGGSNGRLGDVTSSSGDCWTAQRLGRALAAGDLDNDGRIDLVAVPQNSPLVYFHNRSRAGHSVSFLLEGTRSNRDAIGAMVTIQAGGRTRRAWRHGGGSYQSSSDPRLHFGLDEDRIEWVEVRWPSGHVDRFDQPTADHGYRLREGNGTPIPLKGYRHH